MNERNYKGPNDSFEISFNSLNKSYEKTKSINRMTSTKVKV